MNVRGIIRIAAGTVAAALLMPAQSAESWFAPPAKFAGDFGNYASPLKFYDGRPVRDAADWAKRRQEILSTWHELIGPWPPLIEKPRLEYLRTLARENFTQHRI